MHAGRPRGLWARGERWLAHAGVLEAIRPEASGARRFADVRVAARAAAPEIVGAGAGGSDSPPDGGAVRFYGGFAFRDDPRGGSFWDGFPPALFHLPRVELESSAAGGSRLTVRRAVLPDADAAEVGRSLESVEDEAAALAAGLEGAADEGTTSGAPVSAERVETDRSAWEGAVRETLEAIGSGRIRKAVLARTLDVTPPRPIDPVGVALALRDQNRGAHCFLFEPEPGRCLLGAAPETVATLRGGAFHATAVAGSIRRGESEEEGEALARRLLGSEKDRAEQQVVVEDVVRRLGPLAREVRAQDEPHVLTLARIQHLETVIRARVAPGGHVLELVEALHPTPAVCGVPRDAALAFLEEEEPFERGWYAGPVGWFDTEGDGILVPALRSAVVASGAWRLFAGSGIVAGSDPALEWEETAIKFEPVLRALEAAGLRT
ncbi:MAG: isochorismate synthase [Gemmatimonadota bacterium]|jgi:menaquinone-specific isochorismate synthase